MIMHPLPLYPQENHNVEKNRVVLSMHELFCFSFQKLFQSIDEENFSVRITLFVIRKANLPLRFQQVTSKRSFALIKTYVNKFQLIRSYLLESQFSSRKENFAFLSRPSGVSNVDMSRTSIIWKKKKC